MGFGRVEDGIDHVIGGETVPEHGPCPFPGVEAGEEVGGLMDEETKLAETTKRAGGNIRKATNELGDAVKKFESSVNFDRLERCTALLERAAAAMKTLAELEQAGKLNKIFEAVK